MTPEQHAAKIRELEKPMAAAYLAEVRAVDGEATVAEVERLLREGDSEGLVSYLSLGGLAAFFEMFRAAFVQGANNEAIGRFRFDSNTWAVINLLREEGDSLRAVADMDLRKSVNAIIGNGQSIRNQALDLIGVRSRLTGRRSGGVVGLPIQMTEWVQSAREQLLSGERAAMRAYLNRKLRDTAFDKFVTPGKALTVEQANTIARAYADKLVKSYAKQLSETYAQAAYEAGRRAVLQQQIEKGNLTSDQIEKDWFTSRDERVRASHAVMHGQKRPFDEPFVSGLGGLMMQPGDASLGASDADRYGCRCTARYTLRKRF